MKIYPNGLPPFKMIKMSNPTFQYYEDELQSSRIVAALTYNFDNRDELIWFLWTKYKQYKTMFYFHIGNDYIRGAWI